MVLVDIIMRCFWLYGCDVDVVYCARANSYIITVGRKGHGSSPTDPKVVWASLKWGTRWYMRCNSIKHLLSSQKWILGSWPYWNQKGTSTSVASSRTSYAGQKQLMHTGHPECHPTSSKINSIAIVEDESHSCCFFSLIWVTCSVFGVFPIKFDVWLSLD